MYRHHGTGGIGVNATDIPLYSTLPPAPVFFRNAAELGLRAGATLAPIVAPAHLYPAARAGSTAAVWAANKLVGASQRKVGSYHYPRVPYAIIQRRTRPGRYFRPKLSFMKHLRHRFGNWYTNRRYRRRFHRHRPRYIPRKV